MILGEHNGNNLLPSTYKMLAAAVELNKPTDVFISGYNLNDLVANLKLPSNLVRKVIFTNHSDLKDKYF